jgi:SNF2 family DNA or RNA helicase
LSQLDPVQIAALEFSNGKFGAGFFAEQGLGKTLIALAEFSFLHSQGKCDRMIVICPNTFKAGWLDEIDKHGFKFDVHIWRSSKKAAAADWLNSRHALPPVLIINYQAARMPGVTRALQIWAARGVAYLAIDESIQIKGHKSAQTKAIHKLASWSPITGEPTVCRYIRLLTGRPQTQGPHDLWGQLRAIGLFTSTNFFAFRGLYCQMGGWQNKEVIAAKNTDQLAAYMSQVVFQAKKKDWLPNLPRKDATIRDYKMSDDQQRQYNQMERQFLLQINNDDTITVEVAIAKYAKLAQIQCGFIYDEEKIVHELVPLAENPRLNLLLEILEEECEGKVCVVYRHRAVLPILLQALHHWSPAWIKGGMSPDETEVQKARFNSDPQCRIILLQADAAKYGHTLLGGPGPEDKCRTMIFFENSYSADTRDQIEDRIHRRGQTGEYVLYIDLSGSDLDRRIVKALQRKDALYKSVFRNLRTSTPAEAA